MDDLHMFSKVVRSGDKVEVYVYSTGIKVGHERSYDIVKRKQDNTDETLEKREDNLLRARQRIRRIIWANIGQYTKFVTLTYRETILEIKQVQRDIRTFVQAMRRKSYDMKYLYVLEHQTERGKKEGNDGCWHIHMVIFIDDFIPKSDLESCWKHGWVDINSIDDVKDLGAYVCKYLTKENSREFGSRAFSASIGLEKAVEERFYTEGLSDTTVGLHPKEVLNNLDVCYNSQVRHDYLDEDGAGHALIVNYFQGTWKNGDIIDNYQKQEALDNE